MNIFLAFITGLTTGGLSCMAVQGGLLASSLAGQIEDDIRSGSENTPRNRRGTNYAPQHRTRLAWPILAFLTAKLAAYTLLGLLLGLVGGVFQLAPITRALLQITIGVFMLGNGLRMLNVHPIFRFFAFEPPAFLRRRLRRTAADPSLVTPVLLGLLTVLIPCGVTQAMMAVALGAGSPLEGAALMFAFTLGTSPVFFAVAYFATRLGSRLEKYFMRFTAVVVLVLALVTIDSGIALAGSPVSFTRLVSSVLNQSTQSIQVTGQEPNKNGLPSGFTGEELPVTASADENVVTVQVENNGYSPDVVHAKAGVPLKLRLTSENVRSCSRAFVIPALGVQELLEATGEIVIDIPAQQKGTRIPFSCSMGMFGGMIIFDL